ncbi:hypothetical protein D3C86_1513770 [compost metagenome]
MLEAWDIELAFRRLRQRLGSGAVTLILAALLLVPSAHPAWAAEPLISPDSPRLQEQPLTSQASRDSIKTILDQPPFKNKETLTRYRFGEDTPTAPPNSDRTPDWLTALLNLSTSLIKAVLWGTVVGAIGFLLWRYRDWLQAFVSRRPVRPPKVARPLPRQAFGLDLGRETLPADIAASAEHLWQTDPREALGLLYRALLSHLLHDFDMALKPADTEGQVLERIERLQRPELLAFSKNLTGHWQNIAYGHRLPPASVQQQLCDGWRALFGPGAAR